MSDTAHPSADTLTPITLASSSTPRPGLGANLWQYRRPAGVAVLALGAAGGVFGVLLGEHGPAVLAGVYQVARLGWPAVALVVSLVAFFSMVRIVNAVLGAVQLLAEQLRASGQHNEQTRKDVVHIKEDIEKVSIVLERLVERTQPGVGPPSGTMPPLDPQRP